MTRRSGIRTLVAINQRGSTTGARSAEGERRAGVRPEGPNLTALSPSLHVSGLTLLCIEVARPMLRGAALSNAVLCESEPNLTRGGLIHTASLARAELEAGG